MFYFEKAPDEVVTGVGIDFSNWLKDGESITSNDVQDVSGLPPIVSSANNTSTVSTCTLAGGRPGEYREIVFTIGTNYGNTYQERIKVKILDVSIIST